MFTLFQPKKKPLVPERHALVGVILLLLATSGYLLWKNMVPKDTVVLESVSPSGDDSLKDYSPETIETIKSEAVKAGLRAKPEYNNGRITTQVTNFMINHDWATGHVVFMPPSDSHGGPDSAMFVAHYEAAAEEWQVAIEWFDPQFGAWYKESAPLFFEPETVEWIKANY